jgi:hypothetical protein
MSNAGAGTDARANIIRLSEPLENNHSSVRTSQIRALVIARSIRYLLTLNWKNLAATLLGDIDLYSARGRIKRYIRQTLIDMQNIAF